MIKLKIPAKNGSRIARNLRAAIYDHPRDFVRRKEVLQNKRRYNDIGGTVRQQPRGALAAISITWRESLSKD